MTFPDNKLLRELKDVKDKFLKLDAVVLCRPEKIFDKKSQYEVLCQSSNSLSKRILLDSIASGKVGERNLLLCNVVRELLLVLQAHSLQIYSYNICVFLFVTEDNDILIVLCLGSSHCKNIVFIFLL